ncbi:putative ABC transporter substrate-binding protein [Tetragenococcus halophilus subsp. halophilus]|uniref:tryptophan ABC transporter substrate-binding protein n=1 Tax=Tetragenococcus halophilus TaxID=51669 RepID=UPI000CC114EC|nr:tryptophan ABC transporter substrate-binding protein [Tetragenococcus halophilus]MCO8283962.1 ABC transporter substrate-binding protein [Tetragenococcus halophilus]GBD66356.1 putative ABC transporter substrate-binding protein [Tetragenococcus halophilus subsp. halophilus]GBD77595.1 putative ABC transporter substrate-binding protein [Tetragenococcus halophilus subsp. halophilus]
MKNKGLIFSVAVIVVVLAGSLFAFELGKRNSGNAQSEETKKVSILQYVSHPSLDDIRQGVEDGLAQSGYKEGENLELEFQNGQGDQSKLATMSQQLVEGNPDALVGIATPAVQSLANETSDIPIMLGAIADPVGSDLVDSMERPGGNMTGVSNQVPIDQQLDLAKELLPEAKTMGILYSSSEDNAKPQVVEAEKEEKKQDFKTERYAVPSSNEIQQTIQAMDDVDFIYIPNDNTMANAMSTIVNEADKKNIPIIPSVDIMVEEGGVATVGIDQHELGVKTGEMTADILNGDDPAKTPVYVYDEGETYVNQKQVEKYNIDLPKNLEDEAEFIDR